MNSPDIDALKNARDHREIALELQGVSRRFGGRAVLKDVSLNIRRGQFVSMLGASGAGKTTLLRILAGLDKADEGRVRVANARSVVFQEPRLVPARRVWENVVIGHDRLGAAKTTHSPRSTKWVLQVTRKAGQRRFRAAKRNALHWPERSCASRVSCSSMNPSPHSMH